MHMRDPRLVVAGKPRRIGAAPMTCASDAWRWSSRLPGSTSQTILAAPQHELHGHFVPAPGHGLGFNDLKTIECHEFVRRIEGKPANVVGFGEGLAIERTIHAMARPFDEERWVDVGEW